MPKAPKSITISDVKVNASKLAKAAKANFVTAKSLTSVTLAASVKSVAAKTFVKYSKVKTLVVKTTKFTKAGVKNALKGSKVTTVKVSKSCLAKYKKISTKAICGKKVKVVAA